MTTPVSPSQRLVVDIYAFHSADATDLLEEADLIESWTIALDCPETRHPPPLLASSSTSAIELTALSAAISSHLHFSYTNSLMLSSKGALKQALHAVISDKSTALRLLTSKSQHTFPTARLDPATEMTVSVAWSLGVPTVLRPTVPVLDSQHQEKTVSPTAVRSISPSTPSTDKHKRSPKREGGFGPSSPSSRSSSSKQSSSSPSGSPVSRHPPRKKSVHTSSTHLA